MKVFLLLFGLGTIEALGCSCIRHPPFLDTLEYAELVVHGKVVDHEDYQDYTPIMSGSPSQFPKKMVVEIVEIIEGRETRQRIRVRGDDGVSCLRYAHEFDVGHHYVFALYEYNGIYWLSSCGEFVLEVIGPDVFGEISNFQYEQELWSLEKLKDVIDECQDGS